MNQKFQDRLLTICLVVAILFIGALMIRDRAKETPEPPPKLQASRPGPGLKRMELECAACGAFGETVVKTEVNEVTLDCACGGTMRKPK